MGLWTEPPRIRQFRTLDEFPAPGLDALGATASQALYDSPLQQIQRRLEDSRARDPYVWEIDETGARIVGDKPRVDRTTAIDRAKAEGVDLKIPDEGVTEDYLQLLIKRKKEYQQRQDVIDRGPKGVVFGTAQFVSALGASLLDPLNLAASFVPVGQLVAPAMALRASQAATLGARTAARAGVGAIEGAVGQALLEPLTYYSYDQEQLDYTVVNSLQNIAFGALLGSAAHTGFGLIRDKLGASAVATPDPLNKLDPGVQQEILKIRVADLLEGKTTDVTPIIRAAEAKTSTVASDVSQPLTGPAISLAHTNNTFKGQAPGAGRSVGMTQPKGTPVEKLFSNFADDIRDTLGGLTAKEKLVNFREAMFNRANVEPKQFTKDPLESQEFPFIEGTTIRVEAVKSGRTRVQILSGQEVIGAARIERGMIDAIAVKESAKGKGFGEALLRFLDDQNIANIYEVPDRSPGFVKIQKKVISDKLAASGADETALNADDLARAARNRNLPEADRNADFDALRDVDNTVGPEPKLDEDMQRLKEDTDEMLRQANETAQQMNLELPELRAADELEAKLRQYIKAVNAAATCGIRG